MDAGKELACNHSALLVLKQTHARIRPFPILEAFCQKSGEASQSDGALTPSVWKVNLDEPVELAPPSSLYFLLQASCQLRFEQTVHMFPGRPENLLVPEQSEFLGFSCQPKYSLGKTWSGVPLQTSFLLPGRLGR